MTRVGWTHVGSSWVVNLDGSDARRALSTPRLEVHRTMDGYLAACVLGPKWFGCAPHDSVDDCRREIVDRALRSDAPELVAYREALQHLTVH